MDRDVFFAFAHGIRMTLESLGMPFDVDTMHPILQRMDAILGDAKHSLVKGDDSVTDWSQFRRLREVEQQLCVAYLKEVNGNNQPVPPDEPGENDGQPS